MMSNSQRRGAGPAVQSALRRFVLMAGAGSAAGVAMNALPWIRTAHAAKPDRKVAAALRAPAPIVRLHAGEGGTLLGVSTAGELWSITMDDWRRLGSGLDPDVPLAVGYGRVAGRSRDGGLWVLEGGRISQTGPDTLAAHAGLLMLAFAVIGIAAEGDGHGRVARFEPDGARWREAARSTAAVLPDARPVRFDAAGSQSDENGHVAVFGAPDDQRYRHAVLGDAVEATALYVLERHSLEVMARLELPPPHVFEDIAPRPVAWGSGRGLLTVRSGPLGAQLAVAAISELVPGQLELAALGEPIGTKHRWMSPSTDGVHLLAVHTPHIGGLLHRYHADAGRLAGQMLVDGVNNHHIGQRELDVTAWQEGFFIVPAQDRRSLRILDISAGVVPPREVDLGSSAAVVAMQAWTRGGRPGVALALTDGSVAWLDLAR